MNDYSQQAFSSIYDNHGFGSTESRSGPGSTLQETAKLRSALTNLIRERSIKSVTDFPCGDLNWMKLMFPVIEKYTGCDIVPQCIEDNRKLFPGWPSNSFECLDLSTDPIPSSDLLIVRDVIGHQPIEVGKAIVDNILKSGCKYLLSTTWATKTAQGWEPCKPGRIDRENEGVDFGRFYPVNLMSEPFNLPPADQYIEEDVVVDGHESGNRKTLALWDISKIKSSVSMTTNTSNQVDNLTIVSGLWDIQRTGRDFSTYKEHFDKFLKIPCPMVLFVPRDLESFVWERRDRSNTLVKIYELEDIKNIMFSPFWDWWHAIRSSDQWKNQAAWLGESPQCQNEWYNPIVMSKMFFMHDAKIWNQFDTDYFMWLDAGISQTCYENYFYNKTILERVRDSIDPFLFLSYPYQPGPEVHGFTTSAMNEYAGEPVDYVCRGGLFAGHKDFLSEANSTYYGLLEQSLSRGFAGTEESVFTLMSYLHPENYRRYSLDENGLIVKFIQEAEQKLPGLVPVKSKKPKFTPIVHDISRVKTSLYFLTFNYPEQLEFTINSLQKHENFLTHPQYKYIIDNSTDPAAREQNSALCNKYGFTHLPQNKNTGICGGRQFAAEHFDTSDADFYLFFEDDMTISDPGEGICRNGFQKYVPGLYTKLHQIMLKEGFDFLKLSYTEVYMDNNIQVSWYNVPQTKRDEIWPNYNKLPVTGFDPNCPRTEFDTIEVLDGLSYITGDIYYANWPHITSKEGNRKMFLDTKWAHPYEQTWMSHIFQETKNGSVRPGMLLASPVTHERFKHYKPEERVES